MGEIVPIFAATFQPGRWVSAWEEIGGLLSLGEGRFGPNGESAVGLLEWTPLHVRNDHPQQVALLRQQIPLGSDERAAAIDYLQPRQATRGW